MPLVDSHAHLDFYTRSSGSEKPGEIDAVISRARAAGVETILAIGIGEGPATMHQALDIAHVHPNIYASAGIHPQEAHQATEENLAKLATLAADPRCIAIGEIGLDYYHLDNPLPPIQHQAFIAQMKIAAAARKPILIHCRTSELATPAAKAKFEAPQHGPANPDAAWDDLLALIAEHWTPTNLGGVMHCFSGSVAQAERSLAAGFHLSFAGNLTYPKSTAIREAATQAPADRILVETDAPFLAPIPHRGQQNEPALMIHTAAALATLRNITPEALATLTTTNFHNLFPTTKT
jgi:TatD DNase family protein